MSWKISLDTVSYPAYFYDGPPVSLEDALLNAKKWGFDGIDVFPHRPVGFPLDLKKDRRKKLRDMAGELGVEIACVGPATDYRRSTHVLINRTEKEILWTKECIELAADLGAPLVRIFAGFVGYFYHRGWNLGYGNTAMWEAQTIEVSQEKDFMIEWDNAKAAIKECAQIAADYGVTLALQNHPPLTNNTEETLEMIEEIDEPNLQCCLDLPLFESQSTDFVWKVVQRTGSRFVHSHLIGLRYLGGMNNSYGFKETIMADGQENWTEFFKAAKEIGYDGYFAHEQCSPIVLDHHRQAGLDEVNRRFIEGIKWFRELTGKIDRGEV
jgi:sugar phosphate isomerase/epimerase